MKAWVLAMRAGDYAAAFRVSDAVLAKRDAASRDDPLVPLHERWVWDGRGFDGADVLVRCYHGLGDTLQFCRYLAPLRARAGRVTLEVQPALLRMLRGLGGVDRMVGFDPARPLAATSCDMEVMELGHALRLGPGRGECLRARAMEGMAGRVGFCWRGGAWDGARDVPVATLRPLVALCPGGVVSLQRGVGAGEAGVIDAEDPLGGSMDVAAMAGLIAGLSVVVTVDTMVAHLAGSLGRPTVVLLKHEADWRWGSGEGVSPWYGSVRMVRQVRAGDWEGVVARAGGLLAGTLGGVAGC